MMAKLIGTSPEQIPLNQYLGSLAYQNKQLPVGDVVGASDSQTLTNKTLTNPTIDGFTGNTSAINVGSGQFQKDVNGNVGIGGDTTGVVAGVTVTSKFCVKNEGDSPVAGFVHVNNTTAGSGSGTFACRSRGTTASPAIVQNNDALWNMFVAGYDGTDLALAAQISVEVDGTPGSNDMPGRILFKTTPDGQQAPVERMRIASDGSQYSVIPGGTTLYPEFKCRAWVNFDGTTAGANPASMTILGSGNVSSVTRTAAGVYTVNFTTSMADSNYCANATHSSSTSQGGAFVTSKSTTSCEVRTQAAGSLSNVADCSVSVFR